MIFLHGFDLFLPNYYDLFEGVFSSSSSVVEYSLKVVVILRCKTRIISISVFLCDSQIEEICQVAYVIDQAKLKQFFYCRSSSVQ